MSDKDSRVLLTIPTPTLAAFDRVAADLGVTRNALLNLAVAEFLTSHADAVDSLRRIVAA